MKIDFRDNNLIVFLNKKMVSGVDFFNKSILEKYFRDLFLKFNETYDIDMNGSYNINVFADDNYGIVLEIEKEEIEYFDYYDVVDMNITISKYNKFLYKLNNYIDNLGKIYLYNENLYLEPINIDFFKMGLLIENSEVVYGKKCIDIIKNGKEVGNLLIK